VYFPRVGFGKRTSPSEYSGSGFILPRVLGRNSCSVGLYNFYCTTTQWNISKLHIPSRNQCFYWGLDSVQHFSVQLYDHWLWVIKLERYPSTIKLRLNLPAPVCVSAGVASNKSLHWPAHQSPINISSSPALQLLFNVENSIKITNTKLSKPKNYWTLKYLTTTQCARTGVSALWE